MENKNHQDKILLIVALVLCSLIIFYNAFFIPSSNWPAIIKVDSTSTASSDSEKLENEKININTATEQKLSENLNGIGITIARRIIDYRTTNGDFSSIEEIKNVSGIGEKIFENIKSQIYI